MKVRLEATLTSSPKQPSPPLACRCIPLAKNTRLHEQLFVSMRQATRWNSLTRVFMAQFERVGLEPPTLLSVALLRAFREMARVVSIGLPNRNLSSFNTGTERSNP